MWLIIGFMAGWLATSFMRTRESLLLNIIVGIVGAMVAGLILPHYLGIGTINQNPFNLPAMLVSVGGAIILLTVLHLFRRWAGLLY